MANHTSNCEWCGRPLKKEFPNQKYHQGQCSEDARRERERDYWRKYYKNFGFLKKKNGTTHLGSHRNESTNAEIRIIKNEMYRTFSKTPRLYNERESENFSRIYIKIIFSKNLILDKEIKKCPECSGTNILKDYKRAEIFCGSCGLVLLGPSQYGIVFPYKEEYSTPKQEDGKMDDWTSWYVNDWKPGKETIPSSLNDKKVDVICKKCYFPYTIPYSEKQTFHCPLCGSLTMGIGVCRPVESSE